MHPVSWPITQCRIANPLADTYIFMACIVMTHILMAYVVMAYMVMAYIGMAYMLSPM